MLLHLHSWSRYLKLVRRALARRRKKERRRTVRPELERLETRWLLSTGITEYPTHTNGAGPMGITVGSDGNLWFTETSAGRIGRITPAGSATDYALGSNHIPEFITGGPDANLWFTEMVGNPGASNDVGKSTTGGAITQYPVVSPLPKCLSL
jgi:hypothetical protein